MVLGEHFGRHCGVMSWEIGLNARMIPTKLWWRQCAYKAMLLYHHQNLFQPPAILLTLNSRKWLASWTRPSYYSFDPLSLAWVSFTPMTLNFPHVDCSAAVGHALLTVRAEFAIVCLGLYRIHCSFLWSILCGYYICAITNGDDTVWTRADRWLVVLYSSWIIWLPWSRLVIPWSWFAMSLLHWSNVSQSLCRGLKSMSRWFSMSISRHQ